LTHCQNIPAINKFAIGANARLLTFQSQGIEDETYTDNEDKVDNEEQLGSSDGEYQLPCREQKRISEPTFSIVDVLKYPNPNRPKRKRQTTRSSNYIYD
jgi:hypothetical protein